MMDLRTSSFSGFTKTRNFPVTCVKYQQLQKPLERGIAQLVEALRYKSEVAGSIPDCVI